MDRLSRLPTELLDAIFEIAAKNSSSDSNLTTRGISRGLLLSQERALYRTINVKSSQQLSQLVRTLDTQPHKGNHTQRLEWNRAEVDCIRGRNIDVEPLLRLLPNLVKIKFSRVSEAFALHFLKHSNLLSSLRTLRLDETPLSSSLVDCLSRVPTLRRIEVDDGVEQEEDAHWNPAIQVLQVVIRTKHTFRFPAPSRLPQFFPSATIPSVDIGVFCRDASILPLFDILGDGLVVLRLRSDNFYSFHDPIDHLLPKFTGLRYLHLHPPFVSDSFQAHILDLPNLVVLSLAWNAQTPNLDELFGGLRSLPHLHTLTLAYLGIEKGFEFNFDFAQVEFDHPDSYDWDPLVFLEGAEDLFETFDWKLPWNDRISDVLPQVIEMEEKARAVGLVVESNLSELVLVFRLAVVEFYNRAVGDLYFNGFKRPLEYILPLAEKHGLDLDRLEIDLDDDFETEELEWFEDGAYVEGSGEYEGEDWRLVYGLRYKSSLENRSKEEQEEEEESDGSEQSSGESGSD
ncbi:uncharacterized protein JCM6883_005966 [Sporobolomyces salmoneus]|uniref:uncharacterized protein n=1 Tax=Sporobolomyces salmoneus TaxID=183962 RepID=UPI00317F9F10